MTLIKTEHYKSVQKKKATISIDQIKIDLYARTKLDDDRILHFAALYESDPTSVEPIEVAPDFTLTAGRHRMEGAQLAGLKEIDCFIVEIASKAHQMQRAFLENFLSKGPLPLKKADIIHSIKEMIRLGMPLVKITEDLCNIYADKVAKGYIQEARHGIARDKQTKAIRDVTENDVPLSVAAEKHNVKVETLKQLLGKKKTGGKVNAAEFKKVLSTQFRSQGQKISKILENVVKEYENTNMTKSQVLEVFDYFETYVGRQKKRVVEMKDRFSTMS